MAGNLSLVLAFAIAGVGSLSAKPPVTFNLHEPVTITGVPPITLGPGTYVVRTMDSAAGMKVVQVLSQHQDYVYTTVLTVPATRPYADDKRQFVFSESPSGAPPALHFWFPPGESSGHEFINPRGLLPAQFATAGGSLRVRSDPKFADRAHNAEDFYALRDVLQQIESGKLGAARDSFRRNYFLAQNREGAMTSFLLALLMTDTHEAKASLELVNQLDPVRAGVMSDLGVHSVVESLPASRKNLKASVVRRFLLNFAMEMTDDTLPRTAIVTFERHVIKGDSLPVEMALDRRREELARQKKQDERWVLVNPQIAKLTDGVKSLLNQVGALEYSATLEAKLGLFGSLKFSVVLNRRRLGDLDSIVVRSHRTICGRHSQLEWLISRRNAAVARELDSLRSSLRELDRQPGSTTRTRYAYIRNWEAARVDEVSRDLMTLAEAAASPLMRPSNVFRPDSGYVQMNIAGSLARLADWAGL